MDVFTSIRKDIAKFLSDNYDLSLDSIAPESTLEDVGFDSLGVLGIATLLENKYGLAFDATGMSRIETFADLMALVVAKTAERS